jgi:hypothetical protein
MADPTSVGDHEYLAGLHAAVSAALSRGIVAIDEGGGSQSPMPVELSVQARHAARNGVCLDTVLRRYFAGYSLLCDFIVEEAESNSIRGPDLQNVLRAEATLLDRLVIAVTAEYTQEAEGRPQSAAHRRAESVRRLLAGELVDAVELSYEVEAWHLGVVATGSGGESAVRDLAKGLDRRLLLVEPGEGTIWAWFGGRRRLTAEAVVELAASEAPADLSLAVGEPARGLPGWRLTHHQASAALPITARGKERFVRYADVALLATALRDDVLSRSLESVFLAPLRDERDGGQALRETLRAYFAAEGNVSSAAAALRVNRHTVANRLHAAEEHLGRSIGSCAAELEASLRLEELGFAERSSS